MRRTKLLVAALAALPLALTACSDSGSTGTVKTTSAPTTGASSAAPAATACDPVAGQQLVALTDDKQLQNSDNIVPVVRTKVLTPALQTALDKVSAALSQDALNGLNKATDVDRQTPKKAAEDFVKAQGLGDGVSGGSGTVRVVAANFSENQTLANVYADVLKAAGFDSSVKQLTNREVYEAALEKGDVDVVPEYAATLTEFLNTKANGKTATPKATGDITATLAALKELATPKGLTALTAAEATDQNAFAVTTGFADKYGVKTLSDLATKCAGGVTLGGPPECPTRPFCQAGLESKYTLKVTGFTSLDAGGPLSKNALKTGKVALALVFSSDASLSAG
jgi:osmoprotectant transport system substrate-binding protein